MVSIWEIKPWFSQSNTSRLPEDFENDSTTIPGFDEGGGVLRAQPCAILVGSPAHPSTATEDLLKSLDVKLNNNHHNNTNNNTNIVVIIIITIIMIIIIVSGSGVADIWVNYNDLNQRPSPIDDDS